jgi:PhnB protein
MKIHTYLNYGGNCKQAFEFYSKHLGGKINFMMLQNQNPELDKAQAVTAQFQPGWQDTVLHASMEIGGTILMASDFPSDQFERMRSAYLSLQVESSAEAERIHALLAEGGQVLMPMAETFFAHRFSMLRDRFGTQWMVIHQRPMQP